MDQTEKMITGLLDVVDYICFERTKEGKISVEAPSDGSYDPEIFVGDSLEEAMAKALPGIWQKVLERAQEALKAKTDFEKLFPKIAPEETPSPESLGCPFVWI